MIKNLDLGDIAFTRSKTLKLLINKKEVQLGGNSKLKIYGTLNCRSGKRMKPENRVFFSSAAAAIKSGYRPCGHCMAGEYNKWKRGCYSI